MEPISHLSGGLHWRELAEPIGGAGAGGRALPASPQLAKLLNLQNDWRYMHESETLTTYKNI